MKFRHLQVPKAVVLERAFLLDVKQLFHWVSRSSWPNAAFISFQQRLEYSYLRINLGDSSLKVIIFDGGQAAG